MRDYDIAHIVPYVVTEAVALHEVLAWEVFT